MKHIICDVCGKPIEKNQECTFKTFNTEIGPIMLSIGGADIHEKCLLKFAAKELIKQSEMN